MDSNTRELHIKNGLRQINRMIIRGIQIASALWALPFRHFQLES